MRSDYCEIIIVLDESGSMCQLSSDTIGGVNQFIEDQKALPGECNLSLYKFSEYVKTVNSAVPIHVAAPLTKENYKPCGGTALYDAIKQAVDEAGNRFARMQEWQRPSKVILVIVTDGQENASKFATRADIKKTITHQQDIYKWQVVFIGAGIDAFHDAGMIGVNVDHILRASRTEIGTRGYYSSLSFNTAQFRNGGSSSMAFSAEQKAFQDKA